MDNRFADAGLAAYQESMQQQLHQGFEKIEHCLGQLSDEQTWWRPHESMNSIGNLLLHLNGNLRQWLICGLGPETDLRERQKEFDDRSFRPRSALLENLRNTVSTACDHIASQHHEGLLAIRRVQEFDLNGYQVIADSVGHFRGHVQEIIHITRTLRREEYQFSFVPKNPN